MARQERTSKRTYMRADRNKVKCAICGTETSSPALVKIKSITKWACGVCAKRHNQRNGVA